MPLEQVVSLFSALISFAGFLLVVFQLRSATDQRKLESLLHVYAVNHEIITLGFSNPELFQILHGKKADPILERHYLQLWFNQFALIHSFYGRKFFPPEMQESLEQDIRDFLTQENMRRYWLHQRIYYPESFQVFIDGLMGMAGARRERPPSPEDVTTS